MKPIVLVVGALIVLLFFLGLETISQKSLDAIRTGTQSGEIDFSNITRNGYESNYYEQCKGQNSEQIYVAGHCGKHSCSYKFFSESGQTLEETTQIGSGSNYQIKTFVSECHLITESHFLETTTN